VFIGIHQSHPVLRNAGNISGAPVHFYELARVLAGIRQLNAPVRLQRRNRVNKYAVDTDAVYLVSLSVFSSQVQINMYAIDEPPGIVTPFGQRYALGGAVTHGRKALLTHTSLQLSHLVQTTCAITMAWDCGISFIRKDIHGKC
jgi:hypothetical protein